MSKVNQKSVNVNKNGKIVGSCLCTFYNNGKANVMMIDSVEVNEAYKRRGIGAQIIERAIELARYHKVDSIELVVNGDNTIAKRLYKKTGFKKTNKEHYRLILNKK